VLYLDANTASQVIRLSLNEGRLFVDTYTHYLIHIHAKATEIDYYLIADVDDENDRVTEITIGTNANTPLTSSVLITASGEYLFYIYGQNSSTNLDPTNVLVMGLVEQGQLVVRGTQQYYEEDTTVIPDGEETPT